MKRKNERRCNILWAQHEKRYNIGLLIANITDAFSNGIAKGAIRRAAELDANLVIFPGKYIGIQNKYEQYDIKYEYQYNVLFDIAAAAELDYLITAVGTIAYAYDGDQRKAFLDSLGNTPVLSVASEIPVHSRRERAYPECASRGTP